MRGKRRRWLWVWEREVTRDARRGHAGVCLDITALREAQDALDAARTQLGVVVNVAPVILFATDPDGRHHALRGQGARAPRPAPGQMVGTSIFDYGGMPEMAEDARRALAGEPFEHRSARSARASSTAPGAALPRTAR